MNRDAWGVIGVLALVVLGASAWLATHDRVIEHEWSGTQPPAQRDRFLAARRWALELGLETRELAALEQAGELPARSVLVVPAQRGALSPRALASLRGFVERGGHLVLESERHDRDDPAYAAFGIARAATTAEYAADAPDFWANRGAPPLRSNLPGTAGLMRVRVGGDDVPLRVYLHGGESLAVADALWRIGPQDNVQALHFARGRGRVTAISDISFATNAQIGRDDNAEFLWRLVAQAPDASQLVFHLGPRQGLGTWLARHAWPVLAALGVLLLAGLWRAAPRFGPPVPDPAPTRRRLLDHLAASGRYFWGAGRRAALAQAASTAALAAVRRHYPHVARLPDPERAAWLAMRYGLAPAVAMRVIEPGALRTAPALVELTQACARIHAAIDAAATTAPRSRIRPDSHRNPPA